MQRRGNYSIVFCLLLNRVYFMRDQHLLTSPLSRSRATLCEILAVRVLRACGDDVLSLAFVTTTSWPVYAGTDEHILKQVMQELDVDEVEDHVGNAIEMAIIGRAKRFIKSPACQKVIDSIWRYDSKAFYLSSHFYSISAVSVCIKRKVVIQSYPTWVSLLSCMNCLVLTLVFPRRTREHRYTFTTLTRHPYWITIGTRFRLRPSFLSHVPLD